MANLAFKFRLEKLVHALAYFAEARVPDLTKLKAAKLLYFADKMHLLQYGRPILGDVYFCMQYGPVPSVALNQMSDAISEPEVKDNDVSLFKRIVGVHKPPLSSHHVFTDKGHFDRDVFSQSELAVLENTVHEYGHMTAGGLVKLRHDDPTWAISNQDREAEGRMPIPYELFFSGAPDRAQQILQTMQAEREEARELDFLMKFDR